MNDKVRAFRYKDFTNGEYYRPDVPEHQQLMLTLNTDNGPVAVVVCKCGVLCLAGSNTHINNCVSQSNP